MGALFVVLKLYVTMMRLVRSLHGAKTLHGVLYTQVLDERPDLLMKIGCHPFLLGRLTIECEAEAIVAIVVVGTKQLRSGKTLLRGDRRVKGVGEGLFQRLRLAGFYFEFNVQHKHDYLTR
jgi:hypothetical protein